jgi:hypothetical protein
MVNRTKKGLSKELLCANTLKKAGWKIFFRGHTMKQGPFFVGIDFGDVGDVVAGRRQPGQPAERTVISCKHRTSGRLDIAMAEVERFKNDFGLPGETFELWIWHEPRWAGRGKNKKWIEAHWEILRA